MIIRKKSIMVDDTSAQASSAGFSLKQNEMVEKPSYIKLKISGINEQVVEENNFTPAKNFRHGTKRNSPMAG